MEGNDPLWGRDPATQLSSAPSAKQPCFCRERLGGGGGAETDRLKRGCGRITISAPQPFPFKHRHAFVVRGPYSSLFSSVEVVGSPPRSSLFEGPKLEMERVVRRVCPWE